MNHGRGFRSSSGILTGAGGITVVGEKAEVERLKAEAEKLRTTQGTAICLYYL